MRFEIWETQGGAYIPVVEGEFPDKPGQFEVTADVIGPSDPLQMQIAVLRFFDGHSRARSMMRKLGWKIIREIP